MKRQIGFSLIELLVIVAIIFVLAAIAVPLIGQARKSANETAAIGNIKALTAAEFAYASRNSQQFGTMANMYNQGYIDRRFSAAPATVSGYTFNENYSVVGINTGITTVVPNGFGFQAVHQGAAGDYDFEVAPDTVIRYGPAAAPGRQEGDPITR